MSNPFNRPEYGRVPSWPDATGIVNEIMDLAAADSGSDQTNFAGMNPNFSPNFLDSLTSGGPQRSQYSPLLVCPTPPDSVSSANTPSPVGLQNGPPSGGLSGGVQNCPTSSGLPSGGFQNGPASSGLSGGFQNGPTSSGLTGGFQNGPTSIGLAGGFQNGPPKNDPLGGLQNGATSSGLSVDNFGYQPVTVSSPMPSSAAIPAPGRHLSSDTPYRDHGLSCSVPVVRADFERRTAARKPQLTSASCNEASIKILNPKPEYDKIQKKHGPRGKFSEQRIQNGQVEMQIETKLPLHHLEIYVMREFEAEKKLTSKDPNSYGVGPTRFTQLEITPVPGNNPPYNYTYICKFDLDSVYKTMDGKEVYKLEKTKGLEYNRFQLKVYLQFVNGTNAVLYPYEFVLKSAKTIKATTITPASPYGTFQASGSSAASPLPSEAWYSSVICQHLKAEFSRIKTLEVEEIKTSNHDIAYYIKRKDPAERTYEEGDVVGFFENSRGDTVIDLLTSENAHEARLAGVISRSAYLKGHAGRYEREKDADLVCIIGEIKVKVIGRVRTGELIYTCPSDKFPGTATAMKEQGNQRQTLIGYAMGESPGPGVAKVDCLVSLILSIGAKEQLRALDQLRNSIEEMKENLTSSIDTVGIRITRLQRGWKGLWKKLLGVTIFLAIAGTICGVMLAPNSPYVKQKCRADSIKGHSLSFTFYPPHSDDEITVTGLEFTWKNLKKKLDLKFRRKNGTDNYRYFLNKERCETGGIRSVASWLDPSPTEPKVNVLAVNSNCTTVYYHSRRQEIWRTYQKDRVAHVKCIPEKTG